MNWTSWLLVLVLSHLGLAFVLMLRPFFPELVISTDLLSFEHPSVLLFCFFPGHMDRQRLKRGQDPPTSLVATVRTFLAPLRLHRAFNAVPSGQATHVVLWCLHVDQYSRDSCDIGPCCGPPTGSTIPIRARQTGSQAVRSVFVDDPWTAKIVWVQQGDITECDISTMYGCVCPLLNDTQGFLQLRWGLCSYCLSGQNDMVLIILLCSPRELYVKVINKTTSMFAIAH